MAAFRLPRPVGAVAVAGAGGDTGDEAAMDVAETGKRQAGGLAVAVVEQADLNLSGILRDDGEVDAAADGERPERLRQAGGDGDPGRHGIT